MTLAHLEATEGPAAGQVFPLGEQPVTVGRAPRNQVHLEDTAVSRQHVRIFRRKDVFHVADLNSKHGTFVNGVRITREELSHGDEIQLGRSTLRFRIGEPGPVARDAADEEDSVPPTMVWDDAPTVRTRTPTGTAVAAAPVTARTEVTWSRARRPAARRRWRLLFEDLDQRGPMARLFALLIAITVAAGIGYGALRLASLGTGETAEEERDDGSGRPPAPVRPGS